MEDTMKKMLLRESTARAVASYDFTYIFYLIATCFDI